MLNPNIKYTPEWIEITLKDFIIRWILRIRYFADMSFVNNFILKYIGVALFLLYTFNALIGG